MLWCHPPSDPRRTSHSRAEQTHQRLLDRLVESVSSRSSDKVLMSLSQQSCTVAALLSSPSLVHPFFVFLPPSLLFSVRRVSAALPGGVLHQKHERGGDAGQRGAGRLPGSGEERMAAGASQCHQHHLGAGPRWPSASAHQQPEGRVRGFSFSHWRGDDPARFVFFSF